MKASPVYIVAASRTAVVPSGGAFKNLTYEQLAVPPILECIRQSGLQKDDVDELIVSNALGAGGNPARVVALAAGLPDSIAGLSIDRQCVGGLDAILLGKALIASGKAHIVVVGGTESHSLRPKRYFKSDWKSDPEFSEQARFTPWPENDPLMHDAASNLANQFSVDKKLQDQWTTDSHSKAMASREILKNEIVCPKNTNAEYDPYSRALTQKHFQRSNEISDAITAINTSVSADGAAFVVLVSNKIKRKLAIPYTLRLIDGHTLGGNPTLPALAPVAAINQLLAKNHLIPDDLVLIELMEAYAAQAIVCVNKSNLPKERINVSGGSLSRGHPIGASGTVLMVRLFYEFANKNGLGLAAIAGAGGLATALLVEKEAKATNQ